jgi:hypothetical protein
LQEAELAAIRDRLGQERLGLYRSDLAEWFSTALGNKLAPLFSSKLHHQIMAEMFSWSPDKAVP